MSFLIQSFRQALDPAAREAARLEAMAVVPYGEKAAALAGMLAELCRRASLASVPRLRMLDDLPAHAAANRFSATILVNPALMASGNPPGPPIATRNEDETRAMLARQLSHVVFRDRPGDLRAERRADRFAHYLTNRPQALCDVLARMGDAQDREAGIPVAGEPATTMGGIEIANRRAMRQDIIERNARIENILRKMKEPEATRFSEAVEAYNRQMRKAGTIER